MHKVRHICMGLVSFVPILWLYQTISHMHTTTNIEFFVELNLWCCKQFIIIWFNVRCHLFLPQLPYGCYIILALAHRYINLGHDTQTYHVLSMYSKCLLGNKSHMLMKGAREENGPPIGEVTGDRPSLYIVNPACKRSNCVYILQECLSCNMIVIHRLLLSIIIPRS